MAGAARHALLADGGHLADRVDVTGQLEAVTQVVAGQPNVVEQIAVEARQLAQLALGLPAAQDGRHSGDRFHHVA